MIFEGVIHHNVVNKVIEQERFNRFGTMMFTAPRSNDWPEFSQEFLKTKRCVICDGKYRLVAHHIVPFHVDPTLELVAENLIPLCEGRLSCNCHLTFGHLGNWRYGNPLVRDMSSEYGLRFKQVRM